MIASCRSKGLSKVVQVITTKGRLFSTIIPPQDSSVFKISPEVRDALKSRSKPVVALETTIYTHGWTYPFNKDLAAKLESVVREHGGIPATIGLVKGVYHVGMSAQEIDDLLTVDHPSKISRRDFALAIGAGGAGGTTISGTMVLARKAGIKVFATGGLGGVHRGAETSMDISADLTELGRTPIAVVAGGCKGFLDIPKTLEFLETQGVPVVTLSDDQHGDRVEFPAFWSRESGAISPATVSNARSAAEVIHYQSLLGVDSGIFFASPIPKQFEIPRQEMESYIEKAVEASELEGITGKDNTPYVLNKIRELSQNRSVTANEALVISNVKNGTLIARELHNLETQTDGLSFPNPSFPAKAPSMIIEPNQTNLSEQHSTKRPPARVEINTQRDIVVAGALAVDYSCDYAPFYFPNSIMPIMQTSNPAQISSSLGGVGHNIASTAHLLGASVKFCSIVGDDMAGTTALNQLQSRGLDNNGVYQDPEQQSRTAQYVAINDSNKDLVLAMADMGILEQTCPLISEKWQSTIEQCAPKYVITDANWSSEMLYFWLDAGKRQGAQTVFEPVSVAKSTRLFPLPDPSTEYRVGVYPNHKVDIASPNQLELAAMHESARERGYLDNPEWWRVIDSLDMPNPGLQERILRCTSPDLVASGVPQQVIQLLPFMPCIVTTLGPKGVLLSMLLEGDDWRFSVPAARRYIVSRSDLDDKTVRAVYMRLFPVEEHVPAESIVSVNGVGDTFLGALIAEMATPECESIEQAILFAQKAARMALGSPEAVCDSLSSIRKS